MAKPTIAVTMGDPAGVGPELCVKLLAEDSIHAICTPVIYGDMLVLRKAAETVVGVSRREITIDPLSNVVDLQCLSPADFVPGRVSARCGDAAFRYITAAIDAALAGEVAAVVTAPIHKEALAAAGHPYPGHTEIFMARTGAAHSTMMLTSPTITCSLVTAHVGLRDVPGLLSVELILRTIVHTHEALLKMLGRPPRLTMCGLNPHAGEHGLFGDREEERLIIPAMQQARGLGISIDGPFPPDTAFLPRRRAVTDAYICHYHDQGLIPLKALAFDDAINMTLGLPIIRTSVDHGTAFDIVGQGIANPQSLFEAVRFAVRLADG
jgi:4-phospho-D-threonate 3-dehydrogenase / 4-phospho-D-erythronate 3-dehydrogenase